MSVWPAGMRSLALGAVALPRAPHEDNRAITVTLSGMCVFSLNDAEVTDGLTVCRAAGKQLFTLCVRFSISFDSHFSQVGRSNIYSVFLYSKVIPVNLCDVFDINANTYYYYY